MNKTNSVLQEVLSKIRTPEEDVKKIDKLVKKFIEKFKGRLDKLEIDAEVFVGGSFAKNTTIKKQHYNTEIFSKPVPLGVSKTQGLFDIDIFVRFDKKYKKEISKVFEKVLNGVKNKILIHGSRDYFRVKIKEGLFVELIPVIKITKPKEAENITDLSYSHVKYIRKKLKSKKILDEIILAKAFCYANHCYGAESYTRGFSGYGLELLVYRYGGFLNFIKAMSKIKDKEIIDIEKHYKNKQQVLMNINSAKLQSPIVLVDPTYKQRNVLAALSKETFERFQNSCKNFLKAPSVKAFEEQKTDLEKIKKDAKRKNFELVLLETETNKQEGDIAGSKLLKFYEHLASEIAKFFDVKKRGFNYNGKKSARYFFVVKTRKEILIRGPSIKDKKNVVAFERVHKNYFAKKGRVYAKEKIDFSLKKFIKKWSLKNKNMIKEMAVVKLMVLGY